MLGGMSLFVWEANIIFIQRVFLDDLLLMDDINTGTLSPIAKLLSWAAFFCFGCEGMPVKHARQHLLQAEGKGSLLPSRIRKKPRRGSGK